MHRVLPRLAVGLACLFVALNHASAASFPEITKGLGWLAGQPRSDGTLMSEQLSVGALMQARAESFRLLQQQSASALPASAVETLLASSEDNTEFLSRKTILAGVTKRPGTALASALAQRQNADGGFGPAAGYQSSVVDTAWALLAWRAVNYSDTGAIMRALAFIAAHANADAGFGPEHVSAVFHTSYALMALQVHSVALGTSPAMAPARNWLVNHRTQGSFGNVIDNAAGVLALAATSTDGSLFAGAVSALRLSQSADGSWGGDPYAPRSPYRHWLQRTARQRPTARVRSAALWSMPTVVPVSRARRFSLPVLRARPSSVVRAEASCCKVSMRATTA